MRSAGAFVSVCVMLLVAAVFVRGAPMREQQVSEGSDCTIRTLGCLVRQQQQDNTVVLVFVTENMIEQALNWVLNLHRLDVHSYVAVALDMPSFATLSSLGVPVFLGESAVGMWKKDHSRPNPDWVWLVRYEYVLHVLDMGVNVIQSDLDAHWLINPLPQTLERDEDIVLSRATGFPPLIAKTYGAVGCLGYSFLRASPANVAFQREVLRELKAKFHGDHTQMDQTVFNKVLFAPVEPGTVTLAPIGHVVTSMVRPPSSPTASSSPATTTAGATTRGASLPLSVAFLPQTFVMRDAQKVGPAGTPAEADAMDIHVLHVKTKLHMLPFAHLPRHVREAVLASSGTDLDPDDIDVIEDVCPACIDPHSKECLRCLGLWVLRPLWRKHLAAQTSVAFPDSLVAMLAKTVRSEFDNDDDDLDEDELGSEYDEEGSEYEDEDDGDDDGDDGDDGGDDDGDDGDDGGDDDDSEYYDDDDNNRRLLETDALGRPQRQRGGSKKPSRNTRTGKRDTASVDHYDDERDFDAEDAIDFEAIISST
eukprot:m.13094 g.13094  ORF g.13094 m.13094 type:complete len:535 (-) comp4453_c0_seq1:161-1765(-)